MWLLVATGQLALISRELARFNQSADAPSRSPDMPAWRPKSWPGRWPRPGTSTRPSPSSPTARARARDRARPPGASPRAARPAQDARAPPSSAPSPPGRRPAAEARPRGGRARPAGEGRGGPWSPRGSSSALIRPAGVRLTQASPSKASTPRRRHRDRLEGVVGGTRLTVSRLPLHREEARSARHVFRGAVPLRRPCGQPSCSCGGAVSVRPDTWASHHGCRRSKVAETAFAIPDDPVQCRLSSGVRRPFGDRNHHPLANAKKSATGTSRPPGRV